MRRFACVPFATERGLALLILPRSRAGAAHVRARRVTARPATRPGRPRRGRDGGDRDCARCRRRPPLAVTAAAAAAAAAHASVCVGGAACLICAAPRLPDPPPPRAPPGGSGRAAGLVALVLSCRQCRHGEPQESAKMTRRHSACCASTHTAKQRHPGPAAVRVICFHAGGPARRFSPLSQWDIAR